VDSKMKSEDARIKKVIGCNSAKKLNFFKKKVATFFLEITIYFILRISGDFRMS
jgi:hypothetical protein